MQQNYLNSYQQPCAYPQANPNAVSINIFTPQAYANGNAASNPVANNGFYSLYGQNTNPNLPLYPQNYNNLALQNNHTYPNQQVMPANAMQNPMTQQAHQGFVPQNAAQTKDNFNQTGMANNTNLITKTENASSQEEVTNADKKKTKKVVPLTDEYIKSVENYMNNENPKIRLIGTKELLERFKEDENRVDNPSLMPLLNKALKDTSPAVRFLALTILQLGYAAGNDETVTLLKEIQSQNADKIGEDQLLASEILLNMAQPQKVDSPMTENEILKAENAKKKSNDKADKK